MRILRGLTSRFLPCGCLVGIYETYDAETVAVLDAKSASCAHVAHRDGNVVPMNEVEVGVVPAEPVHPQDDTHDSRS